MEMSLWLDAFMAALKQTFDERVWFVGLQGSRGRGEATESSDIDIVVILDEVSPADIRTYRAMLDTLPHRELICGFFSGKNEMMHWDPSDLFQFYHDTTPLQGSMDELLPLIDAVAVDRAIKIGACNIYHGCVHNMLHEQNDEVLKGLYKAASFVIQAIAFKQAGRYVRRQKEVLCVVSEDEQKIIRTFLSLKGGEAIDFQPMSEQLFMWVKKWIG